MTVKNLQQFLIEFVYYKDPNGVLTPLFGGRKTLLSWREVGAPPLDYLSDRGPNQHGRTIRDYRYRERFITLSLYERGLKRQDFWDYEGAIIDVTRPNRTTTNAPSYLLFIAPDNTEREIQARISDGPNGDWNGLGNTVPEDMRERLVFFCDDPFFRDPTQNSQVFTVNPLSTCLATCLPTCLGGSGVINTTIDIVYTGTWFGDQIEIILTGPMVSPIVSNDITGQEIKLNYTIAAGESVTININPRKTTVTNNSGTNLIGTVQNVSDLVDFVLAPCGNLTTDGTNTIRVLATGGDANSSIQMLYYTRDIGLFKKG